MSIQSLLGGYQPHFEISAPTEGPDATRSVDDGEPADARQTSPEAQAPERYPGLANASRVFTIGFCGTGSNSSDANMSARYANGELVSTLLRHTEGDEYVDKLTVDGPGSGNHLMGSAFTHFEKHADTLGKLAGVGMDQNARHALKVLDGKSERVFPSECPVAGRLNGLVAWCQEKWQALTGLGGESAEIAEARAKVRSLEALIANHRKGEITQINVVAWSRGAATAQIFANMLSEDPVLSKIDVRMVAVDPVAGPANHGPNVMTIAPNVKELIVYTATNERSYFFETFLPTNREGRMDDATWVRPTAGNHAMLVGGHKKGAFDAGLAEAVGSGMRMRVADHLRQWGSVINETIPGAGTTVPMMHAKRLDEIQAQIDRASEAGTFDALHRTGYAGMLTHLFDKVYATKDEFVTLPKAQGGDGWLQWLDIRGGSAEPYHPWLRSAAYRVADTLRSIVGAFLPSQTALSEHFAELV